MPIWEWILIAAVAVVVVVAAIVAISMVSFRTKTKRLKQHYGSEYERVVSETGSEKGAVRELTTRERKRDKLDIVPLDAFGALGLHRPLARGAGRVRGQPRDGRRCRRPFGD